MLIYVNMCGKVLLLNFERGTIMFADERKAMILEAILRDGSGYIADLSRQFHVSDETIRRDLNELSKDKKILKVHGGAIAIKHPIREENYKTRVKQNCEAKKKIGQYAASLISDGDIISFDYGATAEEIARSIYNLKNITLITNSFTIASILTEKQKNGDFTGKIIFIGGAVDCETSKTGGEIAMSVLNRFMADKAFVCATSISQSGIMMWDESEGEFSAALSTRSSETYVVADSTKFDKESFYKFLDFNRVNHIITDDENKISDQTKSAICLGNARLHVVKSK